MSGMYYNKIIGLPVRKSEKTTCSSMLTWPAGYKLQIVRVYTRIHGAQGYDYTRIYLYLSA